MDADSLRQITDAIYFLAHILKVIGSAIVVAIGYVGLMVLIDTTRIEKHTKRLAQTVKEI